MPPRNPASETFLSEIISATAFNAAYEHGISMRVRNSASFQRYIVSSSVLTCRLLSLELPWHCNVIRQCAMLQANWEIASHGYRWINYQEIPEDVKENTWRARWKFTNN